MRYFLTSSLRQPIGYHAVSLATLLSLLFFMTSCVSHLQIDCADPSDSSEQALCERSLSSGGDDVMSAVYFATINLIDERHLSLNRWDVVAQQQAWVQEKDSCGEDYHCLNRIYNDRLISLTSEWRGQSFDTISDSLRRSGQVQLESDRLQRVILLGYASGNHASGVPYYNNLFVFEPDGTFKLGHFPPKYWGWGRFPDGISPTPDLYRLNDTFAPVEDGYDALSIEQIGGTNNVGNQYFRIETNCIKLISWDGGVRDNFGGEPDSKICLEDYDSSADGSVEGWIISLEPTR